MLEIYTGCQLRNVFFLVLLLVYMYKTKNNLAPEYLCSIMYSILERLQFQKQSPWSAWSRIKIAEWKPTEICNFKIAGVEGVEWASSVIWKDASSVELFKKNLATYLFHQHFVGQRLIIHYTIIMFSSFTDIQYFKYLCFSSNDVLNLWCMHLICNVFQMWYHARYV